MANVDKWLADAARITKDGGHEIDSDRIMRRLTDRASPTLALATPDARLAMLCAGIAAAIAVITSVASSGGLSGSFPSQPAAVWLSTPPAASPFGLLVGA